ncbi:hypothetical protein [Halorussus vallis]|uniref:hypothetical protein n=1 Tax=Halorussus vallis TaxID=2953749 RepID=UPI003F61BEEC
MSQVDFNETVTARELAKQIVAEEEGVPVAEVPNEEYRSVYSNLTQYCRIPMLLRGASGVLEG